MLSIKEPSIGTTLPLIETKIATHCLHLICYSAYVRSENMDLVPAQYTSLYLTICSYPPVRDRFLGPKWLIGCSLSA